MRLQKIVLLYILLLFLGCSYTDYVEQRIPIKTTDIAKTKTGLVSIMAPINKNIGPFSGASDNTEYVWLEWGIKNTMIASVMISDERIFIFDSDKYLIPKNFEIFEKEIKTKKQYYNDQFGLTYKRAFLDYIDGVKCRTFALDYPTIIYSYKKDGEPTYTDRFETYCSFYKKDGKPIVVRLEYEYSFNRNSKAFTNTNKTKQEVLNNIENIFRQDIQAIFSTIKLGMDREKMRKNGLLFNKPYKVQF